MTCTTPVCIGGDLRHRVQLQSAADPTDGTTNPTYTTYATVWAAVHYVAGREIMRTGVQGVATHKVTMWYRNELTPKHRLLWGTRQLNILSVGDPRGDRRVLELVCQEAV